ncbi:hypothetical protein ACFQE1_02555 [Halobium palmae]|uniref:Uncharacterized protein n=1 Tax=Halobium palmae TaxID=1776492 RepID=A0ABD5RX22_9EURY
MGGSLETLLVIGLTSLFTSGVVLSQLWAYDTALIAAFITDLVASHPLILILVLIGAFSVFVADSRSERANDPRGRS